MAQPRTPMAMPNRNSESRNGNSAAPKARNDRPNQPVARASMTARPIALVAMLESTRPVRYSGIVSGEEKTFRKLRNQTSSI